METDPTHPAASLSGSSADPETFWEPLVRQPDPDSHFQLKSVRRPPQEGILLGCTESGKTSLVIRGLQPLLVPENPVAKHPSWVRDYKCSGTQ